VVDSKVRRRALLTILFAAVLWVSFVGGLAALARGAVKLDAAQVLSAAVRDAQARGSVHETEVNDLNGHLIELATDVALHEGRQKITAPGIGTAYNDVVDGDAYCSGETRSAVLAFCDVSQAAAKLVGTRWIRISPSSGIYTGIATGETLLSALAVIAPHGTLVETGLKTIDGQHAVGITGAASPLANPFTSVTLWITDSSTPLPLQAVFSAPKSTGTAVLSGWGEHLAITPPAHSLAYGSLPH